MPRPGLRDPTYLGDGVYAGYDGFQIWIWKSDGITESDPVTIEPITYNSLHAYAASIWNMGRTGRVED